MYLTPTGQQDLPEQAPLRDQEPFVLDVSRALVVGRSSITCVVVARIVERVGLKTYTEQPETAGKRLSEVLPGLVIVDGGDATRDFEPLMPMLDGVRRAAGGALPVTILLSTANAAAGHAAFGGTVDAVVAKPITPEILQPVVERLLHGR